MCWQRKSNHVTGYRLHVAWSIVHSAGALFQNVAVADGGATSLFHWRNTKASRPFLKLLQIYMTDFVLFLVPFWPLSSQQREYNWRILCFPLEKTSFREKSQDPHGKQLDIMSAARHSSRALSSETGRRKKKPQLLFLKISDKIQNMTSSVTVTTDETRLSGFKKAHNWVHFSALRELTLTGGSWE